MGTIVYVDKQERPRSDCMDAQADLGCCYSDLAYGSFLHIEHHIIYVLREIGQSKQRRPRSHAAESRCLNT